MIIEITNFSETQIFDLISKNGQERKTGYILYEVSLKEFKKWAEESLSKTNDIYVMTIIGNKLWVSPDDSKDLLHIQLKWVK